MKKESDEILVEDIWNEQKKAGLKEFILSESAKQSEERRLRNELLAIQYRMQDYIESENPTNMLRLMDFVKMYLHTLNVTQKKLAELFEMKDSNLHKYLVGERKLNADLVLKLSSFSHVDPEYWFRVEVKNELIEINKEKAKAKDYQKYDYRNLLAAS
ncbi:helix-turn-helix transcriptional regulator [Dyadobacter pollutisoli]|uniref:Helix-turn-helix transcriptional regulator n=1 Tax=Dyadobacter pollutisoli TaxID=2910158 RepID=A0A9E8NJM2_9BACT|nr:helix-turn-helix transcriptional regulator [Dyadobacter pollutisoli]WAC15234.1 helix-turn-helix transcriptional regulator [Dyadobacter pollutisoli]